jgi:glycine C-acetyltransferase
MVEKVNEVAGATDVPAKRANRLGQSPDLDVHAAVHVEMIHRARPFLFSTSHPPSVAATCIAAFDVLEDEPERIEKLWENTRFWKKELGLLGFDIGGKTTPASETPITPIIIGDGKLTMDFSRELFNEGVLGTGIAYPTVPEGKARIRTIMSATHTNEELERALEVLENVGRKMGILG